MHMVKAYQLIWNGWSIRLIITYTRFILIYNFEILILDIVNDIYNQDYAYTYYFTAMN